MANDALTSFYRDLATMLDAGVPVLRALDTLSKRDGLAALGEVRDVVAGGGTIAEGMRRRPEFDGVAVALVGAGEASGTVDAALRRLAEHREQTLQTRRSVVSGLTYPAVVLVVTVAVAVLLMTFVVPTLLDGLPRGRPLPLPTRIVKGASDGLLGCWWVLLPLAVLAGWGGWRWARTDAGQAAVLRLPGVGSVVENRELARWCRVMGVLVGGGVLLREAAGIAAGVVSSEPLRAGAERAAARVRAGEPLAAAGFPRGMVAELEVGESSGKLDETLLRLARSCDEDADETTRRLVTLVQPAMIVLLGGLVLLVVLAVFLPLVGLLGG